MGRYTVKNRHGDRVLVSKEEYERLCGTRETIRYVSGVYRGGMQLEDVPEELRQTVADAVAARTEFSGEYAIPATEALNILTGGAE